MGTENGQRTNKRLGEIIERLMFEHHLNWTTLSYEVRRSDSWLHLLPKLQYKRLKNGFLEDLAKVFGVEPDYFWEYRFNLLIQNLQDGQELVDECLELISKKKGK